MPRTSRSVVRKIDMTRLLDLLAAREITPACFDLLPGGFVRVHLTNPAPANDDAIAASDEEASRAWDEALK